MAGSSLSVDDETARTLVDLGVATASGLSPQTGSSAAQFTNTFVAKANNLSDVVDISVSRSSLGLGSMALESASDYMPINNGALTGTPTAPTQSSSDNSTAIATTAFVNNHCPDASTLSKGRARIATQTEAINGIDTSTIVTPNSMLWQMGNMGNFDLMAMAFASAVSGAGASTATAAGVGKSVTGPTTVAGYGIAYYLNYGVSGNVGNPLTGYNAPFYWSKPLMLSIRFRRSSNQGAAEPCVSRLIVGGRSNGTLTTTGTLTSKGIGFEYTGGGNIFFTVHDGTTLNSYDTGITAANGAVHDINLISDGNGNAYCYIDNVLRYTSASAPTGSGASLANMVIIEVVNTGTTTASGTLQSFNLSLYQPQ